MSEDRKVVRLCARCWRRYGYELELTLARIACKCFVCGAACEPYEQRAVWWP